MLFIAPAGGGVMMMAYAALMPLMPEDEHGFLTGFYSVSRGLGIVTGPILAAL
jgi:MFS family permease